MSPDSVSMQITHNDTLITSYNLLQYTGQWEQSWHKVGISPTCEVGMNPTQVEAIREQKILILSHGWIKCYVIAPKLGFKSMEETHTVFLSNYVILSKILAYTLSLGVKNISQNVVYSISQELCIQFEIYCIYIPTNFIHILQCAKSFFLSFRML